ncbi:stage III sporulation protein AF [Bacillus pakistanensis]|uniref:Stage III sporulation protein AF n=1 Tax=Rossellomorea pakistanensis TaxID=992288 RepID=A0ABS2N9W2_9BACI|nr:stage III sporulation protein AF [Bacillus pakistanensis]MBM7584580.1 stage III sporulation protein AF [Bacillus pakistanensis]
MDYLTEWITNIIIFVLLATVIDMLLPSSSMQKYTKIVTGLILITIILTPLFKLLSTDFEKAIGAIHFEGQVESASVENSIEMKKKEIQASQRAYILEQMAVQMKQDVEKEMIERFDKEIVDIKLKASDIENLPESIEQVNVVLSESNSPSAVAAIQPIEVSSEKDPQTKPDVKDISSLLSKQWNVPNDKLVIEVEGGNEE